MCWVLLLLSAVAVAVGVSHPAFRRGLFFLSFIFINSVGYPPPSLSSPPPLPFFFCLLRANGKRLCLDLTASISSLCHLQTGYFQLSRFPFSGSWLFPLNPPPAWRPCLFPRTYLWALLPGCGKPVEPYRNARAHFGATRPSVARLFPPPDARRIPPLPRFPGRRRPLRSEIARRRAGSSAGHRVGSPRRWGTVAVPSPRNICKSRGGNGAVCFEPISASSGNKMAVGLGFPGFSWGALSVIPATVFGSVLPRACGRIWGRGRIIILITPA